MKQIDAKIIKNEKIAGKFYRMRIASSYLAKEAKPGQFVEVRCAGSSDPLLRRPFGVHRVVKGGIELLYEVIGKGTGLLSLTQEGDSLDVIGPLGHGFDIEASKGASILVAGGNGVAPLLFLAEALIAKSEDVRVLIGGCSETHILCEKDFKRAGATVMVTTEDGSQGHKGLVTHLLDEIAASCDPRLTTIYACGPTGMLKAVAEIARDNRISCQVSLEERMACGVGVCLGCPVKVKNNSYKMVCKDGPVFKAEEIVW